MKQTINRNFLDKAAPGDLSHELLLYKQTSNEIECNISEQKESLFHSQFFAQDHSTVCKANKFVLY